MEDDLKTIIRQEQMLTILRDEIDAKLERLQAARIHLQTQPALKRFHDLIDSIGAGCEVAQGRAPACDGAV